VKRRGGGFSRHSYLVTQKGEKRGGGGSSKKKKKKTPVHTASNVFPVKEKRRERKEEEVEKTPGEDEFDFSAR